jgi:hypothetical protein
LSDLFILAGSVLPQKYPKINNIVCLDIYTKNKYGLRYALFDFNITIDKRALIENIDSLLTYLSMTDGKYKYLPISLSHVYHHCLAFQQYEERLNLAIKNMDFQVTSITLSSSFDYVLVEAIKCICNKKNIDYKILDNEFNPAVAPFQYFSNIDIPGKENIDRFDFSIIIALINRTIYKSDVACMNYPNLTNIKLSKISFSYFSLMKKITARILSINPKTRSYFIKDSDLFNDIERKINSKIGKKSFVKIFTNEVCCFLENYPSEHMDKLTERITQYFRITGIKHLVTNDTISSSCRLASHIIHDLKGTISCLPHGVLMNDKSYIGVWPHAPDTIFAWTNDALNKYTILKYNAVLSGHPTINKNKGLEKTINLPVTTNTKVLVVLSSGDLDYPDEFIRDAILLHRLLLDKFSLSADFKIKKYNLDNEDPRNSVKFYNTLYRDLGIEIKYIDPSINLESIYKDYDLIIVCMITTCTLEVIESGVPIVIYSRQQLDLDLVDVSELPVFNTVEKLGEFLEQGNYMEYYNYQAEVRSGLKSTNFDRFIRSIT